jgi:hypothetical protein
MRDCSTAFTAATVPLRALAQLGRNQFLAVKHDQIGGNILSPISA